MEWTEHKIFYKEIRGTTSGISYNVVPRSKRNSSKFHILLCTYPSYKTILCIRLLQYFVNKVRRFKVLSKASEFYNDKCKDN